MPCGEINTSKLTNWLWSKFSLDFSICGALFV